MTASDRTVFMLARRINVHRLLDLPLSRLGLGKQTLTRATAADPRQPRKSAAGAERVRWGASGRHCTPVGACLRKRRNPTPRLQANNDSTSRLADSSDGLLGLESQAPLRDSAKKGGPEGPP